MKKILLFLLFLNAAGIRAQLYERGKKNFFLEPGASVNFTNSHIWAFTGQNRGMSYGLTGGKLFLNLFRVGLVYQYHQHQYVFEGLENLGIDRHYTGLRADIKLPLFNVYLGKSRHYECTVLHSHLFLGPEYGMGFGNGSNQSEFLLNASYGILVKKSGSSKKQAAYDFYILLNMKKGLSSFTASTNLYGTYWGLSFMLVKYRTGRWN